MNGYKAFYRGRSCEVYAPSSRQAQDEAAKVFKAKQSWQITVMLCERDVGPDGKGTQVTHSTSSI